MPRNRSCAPRRWPCSMPIRPRRWTWRSRRCCSGLPTEPVPAKTAHDHFGSAWVAGVRCPADAEERLATDVPNFSWLLDSGRARRLECALNEGLWSPHGRSGRSIRTISELSRKRSKTICLPSGVMSNVRMLPLFAKRVSGLLFQVLRSRSQKSWDGPAPCI